MHCLPIPSHLTFARPERFMLESWTGARQFQVESRQESRWAPRLEWLPPSPLSFNRPLRRGPLVGLSAIAKQARRCSSFDGHELFHCRVPMQSWMSPDGCVCQHVASRVFEVATGIDSGKPINLYSTGGQRQTSLEMAWANLHSAVDRTR